MARSLIQAIMFVTLFANKGVPHGGGRQFFVPGGDVHTYMHNFIKHTRTWMAALIAFPFVLLVYMVSFISLLVFALAMALITIPRIIIRTIGPSMARDEMPRYNNPVMCLMQRMADAADWPNR